MWPFDRWSRRDRETPQDPRTPVVDDEAIRDEAEHDSWEVLRGLFGENLTVAGVEITDKTAMRVSAVYACVRLIAGAVSSIPLQAYRRFSGVERDRERIDHPLLPLLNRQPSPLWSARAWWEFVVIQMLLRGDSFAYIQRNRAGDPTGVLPMTRSQTLVEKLDPPDPRLSPRLRYFFSTDAGTFGADQDDVLHFPGFGFDGCRGLSVIQHGARTSTGIAISADEHAANFFSQGTKIDHVVKAQGKMSEEQQQAFLAAWRRKYAGRNATGLPLILTEGLDIDELTMTAKDAQLLESRQWQVIDICRAFGVPPHMVAEQTRNTSWGSGIEQLGIGFVTYTLQPHLMRIAAELNRKLFPRSPTFLEHNPAGLLRADNQGRAAYYQAALGGTQNPGWMVPNEVRRLENLPPVDGGDRLYGPEPTDESNQPAQAAEG